MNSPSRFRKYTYSLNTFFINNFAIFLVFVLSISSFAAIFGIFLQISLKRPADPWVAALIVDGWRSSTGLPVYESLGQGHATLMYGPAEPFALGLLYKLTPLSNATPQFLALFSSIGSIILCTLMVRKIIPSLLIIPFVLSLISIENRVHYFAEGRPDFMAWFLALAGIIFLYKNAYGKLIIDYIIGVIFLILATLFKQNAAVFSLIPILVVFYEDRGSIFFSRRIISTGPLIALSGLFVFLWIWKPVLSFYMLQLPRSYPINFDLFLKSILLMLTGVPCVWLALGAILSRKLMFDVETKRRIAWLTVTAIVSLGVSGLAAAKVGGSINSLIPWWFSSILLFWLLTSRLANYFEAVRRTPTWAAFMLAGAAALFLTTPPALNWLKNVSVNIGSIAATNAAYDDVITRVKELNGVVYSPEDPTIVLHSKGLATKSLYAELDSTGWSQRIPNTIAADLLRADYIVDTKNWFQDTIQPTDLTNMGFELTWSNDAYGIWRRSAGSEH